MPLWSGRGGIMKPESEKVPVTLITGFLGAGVNFDAITVSLPLL